MSHYETADESSSAYAVRAVNARKVYGKGDTSVEALRNASVEFERGKFTAIMGPSGSGKSTLMHVMAGLDTLTSGQLFVGDTEITGLKEKKLTVLRRDRIGFIFQSGKSLRRRQVEETFDGRQGSALQLLAVSAREDIAIGAHGVLVNRLAASIVVPRAVRYFIYRIVGMKVETPNIFYGAQFASNRVRLGKGTFVNTNVHFEDVAPISIGQDCQIGMEVLFVTSHHEMRDGRISKRPEPRPIVVGDRCWFGARATILPGVTIADDCVIAAGAVVNRDCTESGLYAGIPAKRIGALKH